MLAANWQLDGTLVALVDGEIAGELRVEQTGFGYGEIGMMVAADWRGRGVGTALVGASVGWARARGLQKLVLGWLPDNGAGIALSRQFGFAQTGRRPHPERR